jgi:hypothetical protein
MVVHLEPFDLQMMLGLRIAGKTQIVSQANVVGYFDQKSLVEIPPLTGHTGFDFVPPPDDPGLHQMEFHFFLPRFLDGAAPGRKQSAKEPKPRGRQRRC